MNNSNRAEYPFPENLVSAIFGGCAIGVLNTDQLKGIKHVLSTLGEREQTVIIKRFRDGYTLEEVGKNLHLSRQRIRQIEVAALRKLRHPSRGKYIKEGYSIASGEIEEALNKKYTALEEDRKRRIKEISDIVYKLERRVQTIKTLCGGNFELIMSEVCNIKSEIPGFRYNETIHMVYERGEMPVRVYNCICRHFNTKLGITGDALANLTLFDVAQLTRREAISMRNLGEKSFMELEKILAKHGMQFATEEYI